MHIKLFEQFSEDSDKLKDAIDKVTVEVFNSLDRGEEIPLNSDYTLYRYSADAGWEDEDFDHFVIKDDSGEDILVVQTDGDDGFVFTEI